MYAYRKMKILIATFFAPTSLGSLYERTLSLEFGHFGDNRARARMPGVTIA